MSKTTKKVSMKEALSECGYNNNIKNNLIQFLQSNYCNQKNKLYLFERNEGYPKLFILLLKIPAKFKKTSYDISILIYFPLNFPNSQPEIYFHKYCSIKINPHCLNYIDEQTLKINYDKFFKWENSHDSFKNLIKEIYKQFNINFPIFTSNNQNGNDDEGDCFLKEQCCKEIEFGKQVNNNAQNINQKLKKNQVNNKIKEMKSQDINKYNNTTYKNNIKINNKIQKNEQIFDKMKRTNTNINSNNIFNNNTNNKIGISESFDEKEAKNNLTKILISQLYPKINKINISVNNTFNNLEKVKKELISEIKDFEENEKQRGNVEKSINIMKNELVNYNTNFKIDKNFDQKKKDFSNLDSFLIIKNKEYYILLSKEKTIEEYILVLKKAYEKKNVDLATAMNLIRRYSTQIFYIKYKYKKLKFNQKIFK